MHSGEWDVPTSLPVYTPSGGVPRIVFRENLSFPERVGDKQRGSCAIQGHEDKVGALVLGWPMELRPVEQ